jgi:hypothetical protein
VLARRLRALLALALLRLGLRLTSDHARLLLATLLLYATTLLDS